MRKKIFFKKYLLYIIVFLFSTSVLLGSGLLGNNFRNLLNRNNFKIFNSSKENTKNFYYPNGNIQSKQIYMNNKKVGVWEFYYEDGKLKSTVAFNSYSTNEEALIKNYDTKGVLISSGKMVNGEMVDIWKYYDENGKLSHYFNNSNGEIIAFDENEKPILRMEQGDIVRRLEEIQQEMKNDRDKSSQEWN